MKIETVALIGIAAVVGYHYAKRKSAPAAPAPAASSPPPQVIERVYVEEYPVYGYGYGPWMGFYYGGGHHHHHRRGRRGRR